LLQRCREKKITLNAEKMVLAQPEVKFAGHIVGRHGVRADPDKIKAIQNFPKPMNTTDMRSFLGLVEQLGGFTADIAETLRPLRPLLSTKSPFTWTDEHDRAFEAAK